MGRLNRYLFKNIFEYYPQTDIIMPKYRTCINGFIIEPDRPIRNGDWTGLDLFQHIGKDLAAEWDKQSKTLRVKGIYQ